MEIFKLITSKLYFSTVCVSVLSYIPQLKTKPNHTFISCHYFDPNSPFHEKDNDGIDRSPNELLYRRVKTYEYSKRPDCSSTSHHSVATWWC